MIRDQALRLAGLLVERIGGPSVRPYQPPGLWKELADADDYVQDHGPSLYRRSLYTFWKRTVPPPAMVGIRRTRARDLRGARIANEHAAPGARRAQRRDIRRGGTRLGRAVDVRARAVTRGAARRRPFTRPRPPARPRPDELAILVAGFHDQLARFRRDPKGAEALIGQGESTRDARLDPAELAAYTTMAQLIFNLDETMTKE